MPTRQAWRHTEAHSFICKSFSDEATRWSAFEREFFCFKEGYAAIAKYDTGFQLFMYFEYNNMERAEVCLKSRRASNKLLNWEADSQELLANVVRVWIDGKYNVLPDVGSRLPWETALAKHLPVPHGPLVDLVRKLFTSPDESAKEVANEYRESGVGP